MYPVRLCTSHRVGCLHTLCIAAIDEPTVFLKRSAFLLWKFFTHAGFHSEELMESPGGRFSRNPYCRRSFFFFFYLYCLFFLLQKGKTVCWFRWRIFPFRRPRSINWSRMSFCLHILPQFLQKSTPSTAFFQNDPPRKLQSSIRICFVFRSGISITLAGWQYWIKGMSASCVRK